jgi:IS5 family transposase
MFRTVGDRPALWESLLPAEVLRLPGNWGGWTLYWMTRCSSRRSRRISTRCWDGRLRRRSAICGSCSSSSGTGWALRACAEVSDSISWRRFCRIPLDARVPHPTTLMKLTTHCGGSGGGRAERGAAGQGRRAQAAAHGAGAGRHDGDQRERGLPDRFGVAGPGGREDGADGAPGAGGGRRQPDPGAGPPPRCRAAGEADRRQAAGPHQAEPGRSNAGDRPRDRGAGGPSPDGSGRGRRGTAQRPPGPAQGADRQDAGTAAAGAG